MKIRSVPLAMYFDLLAYPDGVPSFGYPKPPDDPEQPDDSEQNDVWQKQNDDWQRGYDAYRKPFSEAEANAWRLICERAAASQIEVHAFRSIDAKPADLAHYTEQLTATRERVPADVFLQDVSFLALDPPAIVFNNANHWNTAFRDPVVLERTAPDKQPRETRLRGPRPEKMMAVVDEMRRMDITDLSDMKEVAMEAKFRASRDTCRKARSLVMAEKADKHQPATISDNS